MTEVLVSGLTKHYGAKQALFGIDLTVESGEFVTLLGPSGCGKTTTLRCIAGLEKPSGGSISLANRVVVDVERGVFVPPDKRHVGMVFQSYALWPHMTVEENVAYPLRVARVRGAERAERVRFVLDSVGLGEFAKRSVTALSGGQQQRVALARALAARPGIVFYDEPLSNLDTKLRYQMAQQVRTLHNTFETTSIYVTHDQEEAITLSDRIVVMNQGSIEQIGRPEQLYDRPGTAYVADFMGFQNILPGVVRASRGNHVDVCIDGTSVVVAAFSASPQPVSTPVFVAFRAGHIRLTHGQAGAAGAFTAKVKRTTYMGSAVNALLDVAGVSLRSRIDTTDLDRMPAPPRPGDELEVTVSQDRAVALPREGSQGTDYETTRTDAMVLAH